MPVPADLVASAFDQTSVQVPLAARLCPAASAAGLPGELAHTVARVNFAWNVAFMPSAGRGRLGHARPASGFIVQDLMK